ncbi:MAG: hypothetical protein KF799_16320 [Bdellovibrionales bacterium]|nr:hypothetical protein [Bdellovibrionales bacterium]
MNIIEAMNVLQDFRARLEQWGIGNEALVFIGLIALVAWVISAREVLGWFFKTSGVRDEIRDLRREVLELQKLIQEMNEIKEPTDLQKKETIHALRREAEAKPEADEKTSGKFRLDH